MCKIFENEMVHILKNDPDVKHIFITSNEHSKELEEQFRKYGIRFTTRTLENLSSNDRRENLEVVIEVLELGLHVYKEKLKPAILESAEKMEPMVDYILLLYGLCGNALDGIENDLARELRKECGTWFSTYGWSIYGFNILQRDLGVKELEMMKYIFNEISHYKRVLIVETGIEDPDFKDRSARFAEQMDLRLESRTGTLDLLYETWERVKSLATQSAISMNT